MFFPLPQDVGCAVSMSGLSFRPRPIDISKPIPIIRADSVDYEEIIKLAVTVPKIATGMDPEDEEVLLHVCIAP